MVDAGGGDVFLVRIMPHLHLHSPRQVGGRDCGTDSFWFGDGVHCICRFKLLNPSAPSAPGDSESLIRTKAFENGVLALPGTVFLPNGAKTAYVRASFSLLEEAEVREALRRLREVLVREREGRD